MKYYKLSSLFLPKQLHQSCQKNVRSNILKLESILSHEILQTHTFISFFPVFFFFFFTSILSLKCGEQYSKTGRYPSHVNQRARD